MTAAQKVESRRFWPSGGDYIQHSTMVTLARCISGCEIPESVLGGNTFGSGNRPTENDEELGMTAGSVIRNDADKARGAILASLRAEDRGE